MSSDVMQHELVERARESGTLTKADITKAWFIYWLGAEVSSSYERLQSLIFCASMTPIIKKLYPQKEEQVEALKRHLNFFNSEQTFGAVIQGISIAMEEQKTRGEPISDASITGIKTGLMGPLAGMGDSIIWAAVMPLLIAIFIPFAGKCPLSMTKQMRRKQFRVMGVFRAVKVNQRRRRSHCAFAGETVHQFGKKGFADTGGTSQQNVQPVGIQHRRAAFFHRVAQAAIVTNQARKGILCRLVFLNR